MKKRKYNSAQMLYTMAKANLAIVEQDHNETEEAYVKSKNLVNDDGTIPTRIYMIDDETVFDALNEDFSKISEDNGSWAKVLEARDLFMDAESNLLDYALNVVPVPAKEKAILTESAKTNYVIRQKIIDTVMRLDASTVPE